LIAVAGRDRFSHKIPDRVAVRAAAGSAERHN